MAALDVFWIVGPSAIGSETGRPTSRRSAPPPAATFAAFKNVARSGQPAVRYTTRDLPGMIEQPRNVLVAAARQIDDHAVGPPVSAALLPEARHRMGALKRRRDALQGRQPVKGLQRRAVAHREVPRPAGFFQVGVLGPDAGID